jgi:hypothetical protein
MDELAVIDAFRQPVMSSVLLDGLPKDIRLMKALREWLGELIAGAVNQHR